jgi:hypothetical protein
MGIKFIVIRRGIESEGVRVGFELAEVRLINERRLQGIPTNFLASLYTESIFASAREGERIL